VKVHNPNLAQTGGRFSVSNCRTKKEKEEPSGTTEKVLTLNS